ncbi:spermatogenesis-associated protein 7 isoform X2 [Microcaecilia unicolor]|uniref:Spermatogenesis-associated protein 7-like isoform X2 n=1 Tax=Microcaecilia unicolor TaxID=1415580 RepID=A0A6P7XHG8_9AMPH|nr:spermatogenesis-associated protein 7-like isoform X2 [Microcaecilia unicolor]
MDRKMLASKGPPVALIPKYSMMGPFRGHMSIKSSPFFPGSSCKLSTQYIIQDHMATHYKKLLSAKAAVDSSPPKSLWSSIKYKDQQRREDLKKAVKKFKKEIQLNRSAFSSNFGRISPELCMPIMAKNNLQHSHIGSELTIREQRSGLPVQKTPSRSPSPVLIARQTVHDIVQHALSPSTFDPMLNTVLPFMSMNFQSEPHMNAYTTKKKFQDAQTKTYSGDLLDKHSRWFSAAKQPFTPRILKKSAKSFLSKYRYYTSPKKKSPPCGHSSSGFDIMYDPRRLKMYSSIKEDFLKADPGTWDPQKDNKSKLLFTKHQKSDSQRAQLLAIEEELKYLQFLQDLTNDILVGRYSTSMALDGVFREHMESRKHDLDEVKMKNIFRELMNELSSNKTEFSISYTGIQYNDTDAFLAFERPLH